MQISSHRKEVFIVEELENEIYISTTPLKEEINVENNGKDNTDGNETESENWISIE